MPSEQNGQNVGKIIEIKGVVIDAVFPDRLPSIYNALRISVPASNGNQPIELIAVHFPVQASKPQPFQPP